MNAIYVVLDMGELYPTAFKTYAEAVAAVKVMRRADIQEYIKYVDVNDFTFESEIDVPENTETGKTYLFIEMGKINNEISRLPIVV